MHRPPFSQVIVLQQSKPGLLHTTQKAKAPARYKAKAALSHKARGSAGKRGLKWSGLDFTPVEPVRCRSEAREAVKADKRMCWRTFLERLQYDGLKGVG